MGETFAAWREEAVGDPRREWEDELVSRLDEGARVLELGCGGGSPETRRLAQRFAVTGVDISPHPVERARAAIPQATFVCADFTHARRPRALPVGARAGVTTILVTACGAPGAARLLRALRENGEREIRLVGADMSERAIGRHLCDTFHLVPPGADPTFPDALLELVEQEGVDVVLPESSHDLHHLAPRRGEFPVPVLICGPAAEQRSNDKGETFAAMQRIGVGAPDFRRVTGAGGVEHAAHELGYPDRPVCFKPVFSSGSRGFRVLDPGVDRTHQLLNERPGALAMRLEEAVELLPEDDLDLLVMEFLTESERTVDGIADGSRIVLQAPRTRESGRRGLGMYFVTLDAPELVSASERIIAEFELEWFFSIQFMGEKVIEINPRISTMMIQEDFNLPWLAVKRALGEASDDELRAFQDRVRPGHTVLRFFEQVEFDP